MSYVYDSLCHSGQSERKGTHSWDEPGKQVEARRGQEPLVSSQEDRRGSNGPRWGQFIVSGALWISLYTQSRHLIFSNFFLTILIVFFFHFGCLIMAFMSFPLRICSREWLF